jgi:TRAP-type C4-dicarboxylate transport system permease small subunit
MQVFSRYVLNSSFSWTEETARYAFISMGMLGVPIALRRGLHVKIDLLENLLPAGGKLVLRVAIDLMIAFISVVLLIEGINLLISTLELTSTAVGLPYAAFYYTIPVCGFVSVWVILIDLLAAFVEKPLKEEGENV